MKFAIIDDCLSDCKILEKNIQTYLQTQNIAGDIIIYDNSEKFLNAFEIGKFQAIFLEIYLKEIDGMSLAYQIREIDKDCLLIFVTSSDSHAVESFRVRAFYYLLKPFQMDSFKEMMKLCCDKLIKYSRFIEVKEKRSIVHIFFNDILYIDTYGHYIQLHTVNGLVKSRLKFKEISDMLQHDYRFTECYRNILVNLEMVETIVKNDFVLKNGNIIPIQNNRLNLIRQIFLDFIFHKGNSQN